MAWFKITRNRVLGALNHSVWKSAFDISKELCGENYDARVTLFLCELEDDGLADERAQNISEERRKMRGGCDALEYRLTQKGLSAKREKNEKEKHESMDPSLVGQPA